jgi:hypothetical protein
LLLITGWPSCCSGQSWQKKRRCCDGDQGRSKGRPQLVTGLHRQLAEASPPVAGPSSTVAPTVRRVKRAGASSSQRGPLPSFSTSCPAYPLE